MGHGNCLLGGNIGHQAIVKYRSALVFLFSLFAIHDGVRELILRPVREGTPIGVFVNLALMVVMVVGIALSAGGGRGTEPER